MKFFIFLLFPLFLLGSEPSYQTIETPLKQGWNLVGFSKKVAKDDISNTTFTYQKGEWVKNGDIFPADGVWVFSERDETLLLPHSGSELKDSDISKISLSSGWNLISIPIQSAVSPDIFRDQKSVWKYNDGDWSQYRQDANYSEYPQIDVLGVGEGFWVLSEKDEVIDISERESQLHNFSSEKAMNDYLTAMVRYNKNYRGGNFYYSYFRGGGIFEENSLGMIVLDTAVPEMIEDKSSAPTSSESAKSGSVSNTTTTNTQEAEVDEADIVKHDGNHIFYLPANWSENKILVTSFTDILDGNSEPITEINRSKKPSELYLIDNKLIAIYPQNRNFWGFWRNIDYDIWSGKSSIEVYDVSDIQNIKQIEKFEFDGNIVNSRVTGGKLFLVSRYMPYIEVEYPKTYLDCEEDKYCYYQKDEVGYFTSDYKNPIEKEIHTIPTMNNESLISESTIFAPSKINQTPYITSVTEFEISDFSKHNSISVVGGSETIYSSTEALYIVSNEYPRYYNWKDYEDRIAIYKFGISDGLKYSGKCFLDGKILNQFSLSEYQNTLRVATTKSRKWWIDGDSTDNMVFALQEQNGTLETVGEIRGLGKDNEIIRGVRFLGDKGYIVTFEQTDPLYVIDMSDPKNLVQGKNPLEIDGYSTYFHPVNSKLLLSLGVNANSDGRETGYQLQLFNVSDFNNPKLIDKVLMPETQSTDNRWNFYSEAINNHKAFTYRSSDNLFGIPLRELIYNEMSVEDKKNYLAENYVELSEELFEKYELKISYDEVVKKYEWELANGVTVYLETARLERGSVRIETATSIYFPNYFYKNDLKIYQIDTENSKIDFRTDISGGKESSYDYQRGIIFTYQEKNYGLYILGGKFYLGEIE